MSSRPPSAAAPTSAATPSRSAARQPRVRLGVVSYLNALPLIEGLEKLEGASLSLAPPADLLDLLLDGAVDLALAPVIEAIRAPEPVALAPAGGIGSAGETLTVRLFSAAPIDAITRVHADVESRTSVALLRILLRELRGGAAVEIEPLRAPVAEWPEAALLIGDKVETAAPSAATHPHRLDLGEAWRKMTGLPFVYAIWICRARCADTDAVRLAAAVLDRQRRHNATRLEWIAAARGPERGWSVSAARAYLVNNLRYDIGALERSAIEAFLDRARGLGLAARRDTDEPLRWLAPDHWRAAVSPCPR